MAFWNTLKNAINGVIKTNDNQAITGQIMQNVLNSLISNIGENATFAGVATPSTNPGAPDGPVFYFAFQSGTYNNFNSAIINNIDNVKIFKWGGSAWSIIDTGLPNNSKVTGLVQEISDNLLAQVNNKVQELSNKVDNQKNEVNAARDEAIEAINNEEQSAISNFNAQRVTPEMLSESTLQLINSSGGGIITNMADDEDLYSTDGSVSVLKFKNKDYVPENFSGLGRIYLRKNMQLNKNVLTQEMINTANTRYIIQYDYDLNEAEITIPEGCVLDFQGGSLRNGNVNLNYCNIKGKGLKCNIKKIPNIGLYLSSFLSDITDKDLNASVLNSLISEEVPILVDYHEIYFSKELNVTGSVVIETIGAQNANFNFIEEEDQNGLVWSSPGRMSYINKLNINANGYALDFSNANSMCYRSKFSNMEITSYNKTAVYAGDNLFPGNSGHRCFDITFEKVHVSAPKGNGFWGMNGNTMKFFYVSSSNIADSLFYNCQGTFLSCNNQYSATTAITFYKTRKNFANTMERFYSTFISCNIEDYQGKLFDCDNDVSYNFFVFISCCFYANSISGEIKESMFRFNNIFRCAFISCSNLYDNESGNIGMISYDSNISNSIIPIYHDYTKPITISDKYGHFEKYYSAAKDKRTGPMEQDQQPEIYNKIYDNIDTGIANIKSIVYSERKSLVINNTSVNSSSIQFRGNIPNGHYDISCEKDDGTNFIVSYWNIVFSNKVPRQIYKMYLTNKNENTTIIFRNMAGAKAPNYGCSTPSGLNYSLLPGCTIEATIVPDTINAVPMVIVKETFAQTTHGGNTLNRPSTNIYQGYQYYDITLNKPIWWTGSKWVDATGADV